MGQLVDLNFISQLLYPHPLVVVPSEAENVDTLFWSVDGTVNKKVVKINGFWFPLKAVNTEIPVKQLDPHNFGCSAFNQAVGFAENLQRILSDKSRYLFYDQPDLKISLYMDNIQKIIENYIEIVIQGKSLSGHIFEEPTWAILLPGNCSEVEKI